MHRIKFTGMNVIQKLIRLLCICVVVIGCEPDNEHFCTRYQYVYSQLLEPDLPPYHEMKSELVRRITDPKKDQDQAKFMLFVLEDWRLGIKPQHETSQQFCLRSKRWQNY